MASLNALRCLARPTLSLSRSTSSAASAAAFSTTALLAAMPPPPVRIRKSKAIARPKGHKKKDRVIHKKPASGERRAFRKRIQLSNNSALPVAGLSKLQAETMALEDNAGKMYGLSDPLIDQLRALEAFKPNQSWKLFREPHMLVRKESVELIKLMHDSVENKKALRCVLTGKRLSGKSMTMLQATSHALLNNWVVIHLPEGQELTNGHTEYSPVADTDGVQFSQPTYIMRLLQTVYKVNKRIIDTLKAEKAWPAFNIAQGDSLGVLFRNLKEGDQAWPALRLLWTELTVPGRPPVLFTLDGLAHINKISEYRDQNLKLVHGHDLSIVRLFVDAISGKLPLPNGGAVIAAHSDSNALYHPSQELALSQREASQAGREIPPKDPYERGYDDRVYEMLKDCSVLRIEGVSQDEARSLMEYWGASGMIRAALNAGFVTEKWSLGGHGNVGEMERATLNTLRM